MNWVLSACLIGLLKAAELFIACVKLLLSLYQKLQTHSTFPWLEKTLTKTELDMSVRLGGAETLSSEYERVVQEVSLIPFQ